MLATHFDQLRLHCVALALHASHLHRECDFCEAVEALEGDTSNIGVPALSMDVVLSSDTPIIVDGEVHQGKVRHRVDGDGTYIYLGNSEIEEFDSFTAVIDKRLPAWLRDRFDSDLDAIFSAYEQLWGFELEHKATVMLAYKGATADGFSVTGGALDQLLMMELQPPHLAILLFATAAAAAVPIAFLLGRSRSNLSQPRAVQLARCCSGKRPQLASTTSCGTESERRICEPERAVAVAAHINRKHGAVRDQPAREVPVVGAVPP